jgi:NitT/TauT family transport system ATP-binding protein
MCEALGLLRLAELADGDLRLTEDGTSFVHADTDHRKSIFAKALLAHVPLVAAIRRTLDERWNHRASAVRFSDELEDHMSPEYAEATLKTAIAWGRYAELYNYDEQAAQFSLEDIDTAA